MSRRTNSTPNNFANCLVTSVLPTPVGPANTKLPTGLSGAFKPARDNLIADESAVIASSCPKTTRLRSRSRNSRTDLSSLDTVFGGIRAILETISSIFSTVMTVSSCSAFKRRCAPASSMTSIALSGKKRSLINFEDNSTADTKAESSYLT